LPGNIALRRGGVQPPLDGCSGSEATEVSSES